MSDLADRLLVTLDYGIMVCLAFNVGSHSLNDAHINVATFHFSFFNNSMATIYCCNAMSSYGLMRREQGVHNY